jgi:uncharacterized protein YndB with AHSA1/START domain
MTVRVAASVDVAVDPATAFAAVVDLPSQEKWIMLTKLYAVDAEAPVPFVGSRLVAFTGVSGVGFLDTMVVSEYDPPHRWVTAKDGDLLRGVGIMQVEQLPTGSRVTWANELELPFGIAGQLGWLVARPIAQFILGLSLRRLAKKLRSGELPLPARSQVAAG